MKELWTMFLTFCRIGGLTFGGGYSMLPMLQREVVERHGWITQDELVNYFSIGQCLPGIIAVNTALFVGHKRRGIPGALACALGVVFPSFVIILLIATLIKQFAHIQWVQHALRGISAAVCALIINAVAKLYKSSVKNTFGIVLMLIAAALYFFLNLSPVYILVAAAIVGIIYSRVGVKA